MLDLCIFLSWFWWDYFFTGESNIIEFEVKNTLFMDLFLNTHCIALHKMLTDGLEWCGLLWCFYHLFGLSFWRHPFTANEVMECWIIPNPFPWRHFWIAWGWANFYFWVNYSLTYIELVNVPLKRSDVNKMKLCAMLRCPLI